MTWLVLGSGQLYGGHEVGEYEGEPGSVVTRWELTPVHLYSATHTCRWELTAAGPERREVVNTGSVYTAHLLVDQQQGLAYAANYGGNSLSVMELGPAGELGSLVQVERYDACRDASHPHQVKLLHSLCHNPTDQSGCILGSVWVASVWQQTVTRGSWVWVVDLGCDTIRHYRAVGGGVESTGQTAVPAGAGPRHLTLHPAQPLAFLVCELASLVIVYRVDDNTGGLDQLQQLPLSSNQVPVILIPFGGSTFTI